MSSLGTMYITRLYGLKMSPESCVSLNKIDSPWAYLLPCVWLDSIYSPVHCLCYAMYASRLDILTSCLMEHMCFVMQTLMWSCLLADGDSSWRFWQRKILVPCTKAVVLYHVSWQPHIFFSGKPSTLGLCWPLFLYVLYVHRCSHTLQTARWVSGECQACSPDL